MTSSGTWVPPGPSKKASGWRRAEYRARTASTSKVTVDTVRRRYYDWRMAPATKERIDQGTGTGLGAPWNVIVLNDNHNTFQGVASALASTLPEVSYDQGLRFADRIHSSGRAIVWSGHKEVAEHYWQQLRDYGLTMSPLERS